MSTALRPRRRITRRWIAWSVVSAFVLLIGWQVWDIFTGKPDPKIDYATQFYDLASSAQPKDGENAWPMFLDVLKRIDDADKALEQNPEAAQHYTDGVMSYGCFGDVQDLPMTSPHLKPHIAALDGLKRNGTFAMLDKVVVSPRCLRPRVDGTPFAQAYIDEDLQIGSSFRRFAKAEAARMRLAAYRGDWHDYLDSTDQALGALHILENEPSLMNHLVGVECIQLVLGELRTTLYENHLDESTARALLDIVDRRMQLPSPDYVLSGQKLLDLDELQTVYTASGRLPISSFGMFDAVTAAMMTGKPAKRSFNQTLSDVLSIVIPGRSTAIELEGEYVDDCIKLAKEDGPRPSDSKTMAWSKSMPMNQVVIRMLAIDPDMTAYSWRKERQNIQSTRLMLAIEIYIARKGHSPRNLKELTPDILSEIPNDAATGKPFGYRGSAPFSGEQATSYLLWSYGDDCQDNHGYEGQGADWPSGKPGTDVVLNGPRHTPKGIIP